MPNATSFRSFPGHARSPWLAWVLVPAFAIGDLACEAHDPCEVDDAPRSTHDNGLSLNGLSLNGLSLNGLSLNGLSLNGLSLNGLSLNGLSLAGPGFDRIVLGGRSFESLALEGTALVGLDVNGVVVAEPTDLVGAHLRAFSGPHAFEVVIDAVEPDPERTDVTYYALSIEGHNPCGPTGRGLFVSGHWDETGAHHDVDDFEATFSCTTGAIAKCIAWGYAPAVYGADMHQSCVRMARADYCGTSTPYTQEGALIDVFDFRGIVAPEPDRDDLIFEAGWGPDGAVCVHQPRLQVLTAQGEQQYPPCWDALPTCESPVEAFEAGALLLNRSDPTLLKACVAPVHGG